MTDTSTTTSTTLSSLPYHEPSIVTILVLSSLLYLLNVINYVLDRTIYCGLIGQILLSVAWGTPGGKLLGEDAETFIVNLGYLGLILLVYEGGLSTSLPTLLSNAPLSISVALTGISLPIALSYVLLRLTPTTPLQAFAAGAALCSTSLGTTFTVLRASGLVKTRMGVVLSTAAMLDDVVGLVMVQVIGNLGGDKVFRATTVMRPVCVSLGFVVGVVGLARWFVKPATAWVNGWRSKRVKRRMDSAGRQRECGADGIDADWMEKMLASESFAFTMHSALLIAMVVGSSYAGTSNLFAAYLAGAVVSWWDSEVPHPLTRKHIRDHANGPVSEGGDESGAGIPNPEQTSDPDNSRLPTPAPNMTWNSQRQAEHADVTTGAHIFETYYQPALQRILKPFFFASIGFSIPIARMFRGNIVWKGFVYSMLMFIAKLACGLWLVRVSVRIPVVLESVHKLKLWSYWAFNTRNPRRKEIKGKKALNMARGMADGSEGANRGHELERTASSYRERSRKSDILQKGSENTTSTDVQTENNVVIRVPDDLRVKESTSVDVVGPSFADHISGQHEVENKKKQPLGRGGHSISRQEVPTGRHDDIDIKLHTDKQASTDDAPRSNERRKLTWSSHRCITDNARPHEMAPEEDEINQQYQQHPHQPSPASKPISIYPSIIVGAAMTARGEIGFLISSIAQSNGIFDSASSNDNDSQSSPIFLIVTWAIMLCTIVGPIVVGVLVRRVKKLERNANSATGGKEKDVLGVWGVG